MNKLITRGTVVFVSAALIGLVGGSLTGRWEQDRPASPLEMHPAGETQPATSPITVTYSTIGGAFRVPSQIKPGTYLVTSLDSDFTCKWKRVKDWANRPTSELGRGEAKRGENKLMVIVASDVGVQMTTCVWRLA